MKKAKTRKSQTAKPKTRKRKITAINKSLPKKLKKPKATLDDVLRALGPRPSDIGLIDAIGHTAMIGRDDLSSALSEILSKRAQALTQTIIAKMQKKKRRAQGPAK
jgi:outer membrane protein OmpA-like peptidoglycan-associated protein